MEGYRLADQSSARATVVLTVALILFLIGTSLLFQPGTVCADCSCGCPPNNCLDGTTFKTCACSGGGENPPQPTVVGDPDPTPGGGGPAPTPEGGGGGSTCGNGACEAGETCWSCPTDCGSCSTPTPAPEGTYIIIPCSPWPDCSSGWADLKAYHLPGAGVYYITDANCVPEENCVAATPVPNLPPPPRPDDPCDYPPTVSGGVIRQPCTQWPGCEICADVTIPPSAVLRNPWPRGLAGLPNHFWYSKPSEPEKWSGECVPCNTDGNLHEEEPYDCGGGTGTVMEGARVNFQVGVAWRQWSASDGTVFPGASTPLAESVWVVHDREWNGGTRFIPGSTLEYIFETSSYYNPDNPGPILPDDGPTWNPACQEKDCDCDERTLDTRGTESYHVGIQTFWWPEWSFRYDEYVCKVYDVRCESRPGWGAAECDLDGDGSNDADTKSRRICEAWGWNHDVVDLHVSEYGIDCPRGMEKGGWCRYDVRKYGASSPYVPWSSAIVAGANPDGSKCTQYIGGGSGWIDSGTVPVPIIEIQPVAP